MADLEALGSVNRSYWQPHSYSKYTSQITPIASPIEAIEKLNTEFKAADKKTSILNDAYNSLENLAGDNPLVKTYTEKHKQALEDLYTQNDPYEINRGVTKLADRFATDYNNPNSAIGGAKVSNSTHAENIKKAENPVHLVLADEQKALYEKADAQGRRGIEKGYDASTNSFKNGILQPIEYKKHLDLGTLFNNELANWQSDQNSRASVGLSDAIFDPKHEGAYIKTTQGKTELIGINQARNAASRSWDNNIQAQQQYNEQAKAETINKFKDTGLGLGNSDSPEFQQEYEKNYDKLKNNYIDQFTNKLAFKKNTDQITATPNSVYLAEQKAKAIQGVINRTIGQETKNGVVVPTGLGISAKNKADVINVGEDVFKDNSGKVITRNDIIALARQKGFAPSKMADLNNTLSKSGQGSSVAIGSLGAYLKELNITTQVANQADVDNAKDDDYNFYLNVIGHSNLKYGRMFENAKTKLLEKTEWQDKQGSLSDTDFNKEVLKSIKKNNPQIWESLGNFRKKYVDQNNKMSTKEVVDDEADEKIFTVNTEPVELNNTYFEIYDASGNPTSSGTDPKGIKEIKGDKFYRYTKMGMNVLHPTLAGGSTYKLQVSDNKDFTNSTEYNVISKPLEETAKAMRSPIAVNAAAVVGDLQPRYIQETPNDNPITLTEKEFLKNPSKTGYLKVVSSIKGDDNNPQLFSEVINYNANGEPVPFDIDTPSRLSIPEYTKWYRGTKRNLLNAVGNTGITNKAIKNIRSLFGDATEPAEPVTSTEPTGTF